MAWKEGAAAEYAVVTIFPAVGVAATIFALLVLEDRRPFGGHTWLSLAAVATVMLPALVLLARHSDRGLVVGGVARVRDAEERVSLRDRELEAVAAISNALARARDPVAAARPLVRQVRELLGVDFSGVVLVNEDAATATGVHAEGVDGEVDWWHGLDVDLRREPSGIASAVFDASPVAVFDVQGSPVPNPRLAQMVGAKSGTWVPMIAEERVVGVLVAATTREKRAFAPEENALLQALAGEAALALERMRSSDALVEALRREQLVAEIARRIRGELDAGEVVRVAREEVRRALGADAVEIDVSRASALQGEDAELRVTRQEPLSEGERMLVETVAREVSLTLQTARLLAENQRRLEQQGALLHAAQVVTSELELDVVLQRLVEEVTKLLRADAAHCYLLDLERGVLRCAAVHGLDSALVGFEFAPQESSSGLALGDKLAASADVYEWSAARIPHPAYTGFSRTLVAPMVWAGQTRGVLGVGMRDARRDFDDADVELLEAFASLASLALRNAESFGERTRQARVQQAFYRMAELLGEPLSLSETLDAAAQAAVEALGGDFGAVVTHGRGGGMTIAGEYELPPEGRALELPQALADAAADGRILASTRVAADDRLGADWRGGPFASLLAIPIEGDLPGLVLVLFAEERVFVDDDLELARRLARAASGAFDRSRLYEAERTARSLSQQLARTGSLLATELDPAAVLEEVVAQAAGLLGAGAGALAQLEDDELVVTAAVGEGAEDALGARSPSTGWLGGDVVQSRAPVAYADASSDPALAEADTILSAGYRAYLGVPLTGREGALHGVLTVYDREPRRWREEEIEALAALAANASVALSNAELYQRVAVESEQSVAILANVADGIVAVDREGQVVVWNGAAEEITGVPAAEAVGRTPYQVLQRNLASEGTAGGSRLVSLLRGSDEVWLSLSETVMRDPSGAVAGRIFAFRDISAERVVEQMKSDFVSTVSHELRTPLTSIYGFAQTLLRRDIEFAEPERRTFLSYIASESERLTRIVDALLNVARLDTGDLQVSLEPTDVRPMLQAAVATVEAAGSNGHRFVVDAQGEELRAQADPDKLQQVLDQLVGNAVKFSPDGGVVSVLARRLPDAVEITIADEGVGIPQSQRERIFSKFYRGGDGGPETGTGLGLFIAQGLVSAMGGRLWVDSDEGRGSRFTFELPAVETEKGAMMEEAGGA